jgi:hypothetical protein
MESMLHTLPEYLFQVGTDPKLEQEVNKTIQILQKETDQFIEKAMDVQIIELKPPNGLESANRLKPINALEPLDGLEPLNGIEPLDGIEPLNGIEPLDGLDPLNGIEPLDGLEPLNGIEPLDGFVSDGIVSNKKGSNQKKPVKTKRIILRARDKVYDLLPDYGKKVRYTIDTSWRTIVKDIYKTPSIHRIKKYFEAILLVLNEMTGDEDGSALMTQPNANRIGEKPFVPVSIIKPSNRLTSQASTASLSSTSSNGSSNGSEDRSKSLYTDPNVLNQLPNVPDVLNQLPNVPDEGSRLPNVPDEGSRLPNVPDGLDYATRWINRLPNVPGNVRQPTRRGGSNANIPGNLNRPLP